MSEDKLKEQLDDLSRDLDRMKRERDKIDREIALAEEGLKYLKALHNSRSGAYAVRDEARPISAAKYEGMSQVAAARRFITEHENRAFHAAEVWRELSANGIASKAKEPVWALATNLKLSKDFEPIGDAKATFRLTKEAYQRELEKIKREWITGRFPGFNSTSIEHD